jgi:hypothetical protein
MPQIELQIEDRRVIRGMGGQKPRKQQLNVLKIRLALVSVLRRGRLQLKAN